MAVLGVGIYGLNGHQIHPRLTRHPRARLIAAAEVPEGFSREIGLAGLLRYETLEALLVDPEVELVSLCSPRRADQAGQAIAALRAGKHVYAEKPSAMSEPELDEVLRVADQTGRLFREMAGTAFERPYVGVRDAVAKGAIGEVVQVVVQKSYPLHDRRPVDEQADGGLLLQVGVTAVRMIEHVVGLRVIDVHAVETTLGELDESGTRSDLCVAAAMTLRLSNGALATVTLNYLNPAGTKIWGNDLLRVFGRRGLIEVTDGGRVKRLIVGDEDRGVVEAGSPIDHFDAFVDSILDGSTMPISLEEELHPLRVVLRAKAACESRRPIRIHCDPGPQR